MDSTEAAPHPFMETTTAVDFDAVVAEHESAMLRYAHYLLGRDYEGRHHDAQDLVQEALLRLHRQWRQRGTESVRQVGTWLLRVTHNLAMDAIRKRSRKRAAILNLRQASSHTRQPGSEDSNGITELETQEATTHAMRLLHDLPESQQRVMMLRLNDMTVRQIAHVLDMSPGNVGYHMSQALTTMARQLKQAGVI
jgi:RNA polymerase sigma factor (sigma-70 family)